MSDNRNSNEEPVSTDQIIADLEANPRDYQNDPRLIQPPRPPRGNPPPPGGSGGPGGKPNNNDRALADIEKDLMSLVGYVDRNELLIERFEEDFF